MESEVEFKEGREEDLRMIASGTKKGNGTMKLVVIKLKSNKKWGTRKRRRKGSGSNGFPAQNAIKDDGGHRDDDHGIHCPPGVLGIKQQKEE